MKSRFSDSTLLFWALVFFIGGVLLASFWAIPNVYMLTLLLAGLCLLAIDYKNRNYLFLFFCILGFSLGALRIDKENTKIVGKYSQLKEDKVVVVSSPEKTEKVQKIVVSKASDLEDKFLVNASLYPDYQYGQVLKISCLLKDPENFNGKFNYVKYLAKDGIYQICNNPKISQAIECESQNEVANNFPLGKKIKFNFNLVAHSIKTKIEEKIYQLLPMPESAYLAGLLLGGSNRLPLEVADYFKRTGTTHTVAVSGYNITIIAEFLMAIGLAFGLWRQKAFWLAVVGIIFFVLAIGSPSSALRAAIMGILVLWAAKNGRLSNSVRAIVLAAAVMVWISPYVLVYDIGFQLSFLATLGIVLIYGPLAEKFNLKNDFLEFKSILLTTLAAQAGVLGILLYNFEAISPISFLANLIILPAIPLIMLGGMLVVVLGFVALPLAKIVAIPVWLGLGLEIYAVKIMSKVSWSIVEVKGLSWIWLIAYYIFFIFLVIKLRSSKTALEKI